MCYVSVVLVKLKSKVQIASRVALSESKYQSVKKYHENCYKEPIKVRISKKVRWSSRGYK